MANTKKDPGKKRPGRRSQAAKVSKSMAGVRPMKGTPSVAKPYSPGFTPPPEKSPWQDEGRPETAG
jgi:hypothetical protein